MTERENFYAWIESCPLTDYRICGATTISVLYEFQFNTVEPDIDQLLQATSMNFTNRQSNADMLDALADIAHEQEQAMREEWDEPLEVHDKPKD